LSKVNSTGPPVPTGLKQNGVRPEYLSFSSLQKNQKLEPIKSVYLVGMIGLEQFLLYFMMV